MRRTGRDFWAGLRATIKATICPEINRCENYGPVPKTEQRPIVCRRGGQLELRSAAVPGGVAVEGMPGYHSRSEEFDKYRQGRGPAWIEEQRRKEERKQKRLDSEESEEASE